MNSIKSYKYAICIIKYFIHILHSRTMFSFDIPYANYPERSGNMILLFHMILSLCYRENKLFIKHEDKNKSPCI